MDYFPLLFSLFCLTAPFLFIGLARIEVLELYFTWSFSPTRLFLYHIERMNSISLIKEPIKVNQILTLSLCSW